MIERLRKEMDNVGSFNPGMADGGMVEHSDESQDVDMIKSILQKIIDEMDQMESNSFLPESKRPKAVSAEVHVEGSPSEENSTSPEDDSDENDSNLLPSLMGKAHEADENGEMPEDRENDVEPELASIIAEKKKQLPK